MSIDKLVSVQDLEIIVIKCFAAEYRAMLTTITEMIIKKLSPSYKRHGTKIPAKINITLPE